MELRVDPLRGHVSLVSEARKKRPKVFKRLHLVAVEAWRHVADPHMIPLGEYREALSFILDECRAAMRSYGYLVLFKNRGRLVGASIEHCHMQIMAMKEPPPLEKTWAREAWRDRCPLCSYIAWEAEAGERILEERD